MFLCCIIAGTFLPSFCKDRDKRARNIKLAWIFFTASADYLRYLSKIETNERESLHKRVEKFIFTQRVQTNLDKIKYQACFGVFEMLVEFIVKRWWKVGAKNGLV